VVVKAKRGRSTCSRVSSSRRILGILLARLSECCLRQKSFNNTQHYSTLLYSFNTLRGIIIQERSFRIFPLTLRSSSRISILFVDGAIIIIFTLLSPLTTLLIIFLVTAQVWEAVSIFCIIAKLRRSVINCSVI
jgi:hypothetical protein